MGYKIGRSSNLGEAKNGETPVKGKPPVVQDMYMGNLVTGRSMNVVKRSVPRMPVGKPANQYGDSRIIAGRKGK